MAGEKRSNVIDSTLLVSLKGPIGVNEIHRLGHLINDVSAFSLEEKST